MAWLIVALIVILFLAVCAVWQRIAVKSEMRAFPCPGKMVDVPGAKMHVLAQGTGTPVVLLSGWSTAAPSIDFQPLREELNKRGFRAVIVEKPGYGYSDWTKAPRDVDTVVEEMRLAVSRAGEKGPYILCGHSMAGVEMLRWACRHPKEVRAVYTLDAPAPLCYTSIPLPPKALGFFQAFLRFSGLRRLMMLIPLYRKNYWKYLNGYRYLDPSFLNAEKAMQLRNYACPPVREEIRLLPANSRKAGDRLPEGIPLTMFIAGETREKMWAQLQPMEDEYIQKNHARVIDLPGRHNLQHYGPDVIAQTIADECKEARP